MHQEWKDERLKFNSPIPNATVILTGDSVNDVWLPDLWIINERSVPLNRFPTSASTVLLKSEGYIHYTSRYPFRNIEICYVVKLFKVSTSSNSSTKDIVEMQSSLPILLSVWVSRRKELVF